MVTMDSLCKCGHALEDHHNAMICDGMVLVDWNTPVATEVMFSPDTDINNIVSIRTSIYCLKNRTDFPHAHGSECEYYGFNETGGLMPLNKDGAPLEWVIDSEGNGYMNEPVSSWVQHCHMFELA